MSFNHATFAWLGIVFLPFAAGCYRSSATASQQSGVRIGGYQSFTGSSEIRVRAEKPQRKTIRRVLDQPGQFEAFETTPIYSKLSGYVKSVEVDIGDHVKKGQTLALLSAPEVEEELKGKIASLAEVKADVEHAAAMAAAAAASKTAAAAKLQESFAALEHAQANLKHAEAEHRRVIELAARSAVTQKLVDESAFSLASAIAGEKESVARIELSKAAVAEAKANEVKAQALVAAKKAHERVVQSEADRAKVMLDYLVLRSPFDGVVAKRGVHTGFLVQAGPTPASGPLFVVDRIDKMRMSVDVPELDAAAIAPGTPVVLKVQSLGGKERSATITRLASSLHASSRTLRCEIDLDNGDHVLRPGMYAAVSVIAAERKDALVVPFKAIASDAEGPFCYAIEGGKAVKKRVQLGVANDSEVEVASGLSGTETIATSNPTALAEGAAVTVNSSPNE